MSTQPALAERPAVLADVNELFVQATSSFTLSLRAWPASIAADWIACPHPDSSQIWNRFDLGSTHPLGLKLRLLACMPLSQPDFLDKVLSHWNT